MIAVITGDIINSRKVESTVWLSPLRNFLQQLAGNEKHWEIYRGDSFQLLVPAQDALRVALSIKALVKANSVLDVRMAIGIGDQDFAGKRITESNGTAFVNSGESFDRLKGQTLILQSPWEEFDQTFNPILGLLAFVCGQWKPVTSQTLFFALTHRDLLQKEIAEQMAKDKTTVNKALKRGGYDEIQGVLELYAKKAGQWKN